MSISSLVLGWMCVTGELSVSQYILIGVMQMVLALAFMAAAMWIMFKMMNYFLKD